MNKLFISLAALALVFAVSARAQGEAPAAGDAAAAADTAAHGKHHKDKGHKAARKAAHKMKKAAQDATATTTEATETK